jgi:hypothetical protein
MIKIIKQNLPILFLELQETDKIILEKIKIISNNEVNSSNEYSIKTGTK